MNKEIFEACEKLIAPVFYPTDTKKAHIEASILLDKIDIQNLRDQFLYNYYKGLTSIDKEEKSEFLWRAYADLHSGPSEAAYFRIGSESGSTILWRAFKERNYDVLKKILIYLYRYYNYKDKNRKYFYLLTAAAIYNKKGENFYPEIIYYPEEKKLIALLDILEEKRY